MPLVYAATTPHTPLLLPTIGKDRRDYMQQTLDAFSTVRQHLNDAKVESIIVLAPHAPHNEQVLYLQHETEFITNLKEFGDIATVKSFHPDHVLSDYIKHHFDQSLIPWVYHSEKDIEYAVSVPLLTLGIESGTPITIVYVPHSLSLTDLSRIGIGLYDALASHSKRTAILLSGDLSHTLSEDAPGGYYKDAKKFDKRVLTLFEKKQPEKLLKTTPETLENVKACAIPPMAILAGVLKHTTYTPHILSYESPLGVGHLVMECII